MQRKCQNHAAVVKETKLATGGAEMLRNKFKLNDRIINLTELLVRTERERGANLREIISKWKM